MGKIASYPEAIHFLYEQLPLFSKSGSTAIKKGLGNITALCEALGRPYEAYKTIHIAGTNGKGSVSHALAAILQQQGYKTGLYTSPHLIDFRERFKIDGKFIPQEWVVDFLNQHQELIAKIQPSFFEITVAMAFRAFADSNVEIAIIETGLGGRLDSTNIITPILSIITNIHFDHCDILGHSLPEIAQEKAGIIKPEIPVLIGEEHPETERIFVEKSIQTKSKIYFAQPVWDLVKTGETIEHQYFKAIHRAERKMYDLTTDLKGFYQKHNIRTVLAAIEILDTTTDIKIDFERSLQSLSSVKKRTGLWGRWDVWQKKPLVIADVAHNPSGMEEAMKQWNEVKAQKKNIMIGFAKDKDMHN